jgi:DNA-directed RNA polymerase specialized sigma24 family protein
MSVSDETIRRFIEHCLNVSRPILTNMRKSFRPLDCDAVAFEVATRIADKAAAGTWPEIDIERPESAEKLVSRATVNEARDFIRKHKREDVNARDYAQCTATSYMGFSDETDSHDEKCCAVEKLLQLLPEHDRELVRLVHLCKMSYAKIIRDFYPGCRESKLRMRVCRSMKWLRDYVATHAK